ncbi:MAG: hypothetical protein QOF40_1158 [Actinomycetota bacterium]|nr:hypothetical protein [Actinomycetota bacterium]
MNARRALLAVVSAVALLGVMPTARAQTSGGGQLGPDSVRASARDVGSGTFPGGGLPSVAPAVESPYEWSRALTGGRCVVFPGTIPPDLPGVTPLPGVFTFPYVSLQVGTLLGAPPRAVRVDGNPPLPAGVVFAGEFVVDTATPRVGTDLRIVPRCVAPGEPLLALPPTAAEIWQQTPLPRATVHANPPGTGTWPGIVNLESRFWGAPLPDARATVELHGYAVTVVAHPVAYAWSFGDGTTSVGSGPGGPETPARAQYRRRGNYDVTLYVVWAGLAHTTAPAWGLDFGVQHLGTVTLPETVVYHEAEIRALLRSRTAGG